MYILRVVVIVKHVAGVRPRHQLGTLFDFFALFIIVLSLLTLLTASSLPQLPKTPNLPFSRSLSLFDSTMLFSRISRIRSTGSNGCRWFLSHKPHLQFLNPPAYSYSSTHKVMLNANASSTL